MLVLPLTNTLLRSTRFPGLGILTAGVTLENSLAGSRLAGEEQPAHKRAMTVHIMSFMLKRLGPSGSAPAWIAQVVLRLQDFKPRGSASHCHQIGGDPQARLAPGRIEGKLGV